MKNSNPNKKPAVYSFTRNFWTVITMEFFERGSYYGVMSVLSVYLVLSIDKGGLGFSKESVGVIKSTITPLLYLLPIFSGAIGDRFGYRKVLTFSFFSMSIGYFLTSISATYEMVFLSLVVVVLGAGFFKPMITGTIARETNEKNSSMGFGVYYWSINLGAFIFPLILVPILKNLSWSYIFVMAAICTGSMLILNIFVFREPKKPENSKSLAEVFKGAFMVLADFRFILMIIIYAGFWILYFQMFDTVLWYLTEHVNMGPVNNSVNSFLSLFVDNPGWKFEAEHVTVINAFTIIALQLIISALVKRFKALPTMVTGILFGTLGMGILAINNNPWLFLLGMFVFSIGEMTAHPKFIAYVGTIAPPDKKALYLGYAFLYGVIGSGIGGILGANLYVHFIDKQNNPAALWMIFAAIGLTTAVGLLLYHKLVASKSKIP